MAITPFELTTPVDFTQDNKAVPQFQGNELEQKIASYITSWRSQCRAMFIQRRNIWDDCWKLYRGTDDYSQKEDWQSKMVLPKSWASVKMATNAIKRLLATAKTPWTIESVNPDDLVTTLRAEQIGDLTKLFLDKANFLQEFTEGLECGFILGLGVWKLWWGLQPRREIKVETNLVQVPTGQMLGNGGLLGTAPSPRDFPPPFGQDPYAYATEASGQYPSQLSGEALNPMGWGNGPAGMLTPPPQSLLIPQKRTVANEVMEGRLFMRAVDPYNFWWLPGSKLNRWVGTIEQVEIPRWELLRMAEQGYFSKEKVEAIQPKRLDERYKMSSLRFSETVMNQNGPNNDTAVCTLTEYFGPLVWEGKVISENAHVILANDTVVLLYQDNPFWNRKPPYVAFSPLSLPFRTEGVGLIEMVRNIDKALSHLANLSVDTLVFRLLPLFEVSVDAFENPEDLETGITPGKILRKNLGNANLQAIRPVEFQDISSGTVQVAAQLDRAHQEGALISDVAEGLPRWRGQQTATETQLLQQQSESFMGNMAVDIEKTAIEPIVTQAMDLVFQFIDTANDPRIGSILGVGADVVASMSREELLEMIQGDYKVKSVGISGQLQKAEMLQNLVQFMNLIGQNPEAWLPYVNQDALLRRILEAFRPQIHDIEDIVADPAIAQAKKVEMQQAQLAPKMMELLPQLMAQSQNADADRNLELQRWQHEQEMAKMDAQTAQGQAILQHAQQMGAQALQAQQMQQAAAQPPTRKE